VVVVKKEVEEEEEVSRRYGKDMKSKLTERR